MFLLHSVALVAASLLAGSVNAYETEQFDWQNVRIGGTTAPNLFVEDLVFNNS